LVSVEGAARPHLNLVELSLGVPGIAWLLNNGRDGEDPPFHFYEGAKTSTTEVFTECAPWFMHFAFYSPWCISMLTCYSIMPIEMV